MVHLFQKAALPKLSQRKQEIITCYLSPMTCSKRQMGDGQQVARLPREVGSKWEKVKHHFYLLEAHGNDDWPDTDAMTTRLDGSCTNSTDEVS